MAFNAAQFLNTEITGGISTEYVPVPDGEWGPAQCTTVKMRNGKNKEGEEWVSLDTTWEIMSDELKGVMNVEKNPVVRSGIFLDFDHEGNLKRGKGENVQLGLLLEAVGMNDPNTGILLGNLKGQTVGALLVKGRLADDGNTYAEAKSFAAA